MEKIVFVGAGPATIGAVLKLIDNKYEGKIVIFEKGKSLDNRLPTEVVEGFAGAGCFSDCKLSSALSVGGIIPNLTQEDLEKYGQEILTYFNRFSPDKLEWSHTSSFDTHTTNLTFDVHKTLHVGSDRGREIFYKMEKFITSQSNIKILFETEVDDVVDHGYLQGFEHPFVVYYHNKERKGYVEADKVIIATGQKNTLPGKLIKKFNLSTTPRALQLGVRVVDEMNPQYEEIIKANYDFKFVKEYNYKNNVKVRVRTFCCNSGNAHVCAEKASEGFVCFNGHAYKTPDPNNHSVNYGIMCEVSGLKKYNSKAKQIELTKKVNNKENWLTDNFNNDGEVRPIRELLKGFKHLKGYYPKVVINSLTDFMWELNKLVDLSKAKYLYPEVKLNEGKAVQTTNWESSLKGLYFIGDCNYTRGIIKSLLSGIGVAEELTNAN